MEKSAVAAHPAVCAQGSGNFRRSRVHQEKLKQKAGADCFAQAFLQASEPSGLPHFAQVFLESWLESPLPQLPQWAKVGDRLRLRRVRVSRMYFI